jgi:two-component system, sensor histidine kinase
VNSRITQSQISLTYKQTRLTSLLNAALITIVGYVVWGEFPQSTVNTWLIYGYLVSLGRTAVLILFDTIIFPARNIETTRAVLLVSLFLSSLIWVAAAFLFLDTNNNEIFLVVCLGISGIVHGGLPSLSIYLPAIFTFATLPLLAATYKFYQLDSLALCLISFLNLLSVAVVSMSVNRAITHSITLEFYNRKLLEDVTEEKINAEQAREHAEQANRSKSEFLAAASHDLRQPLHSMGLFLEALQSRKMSWNNKTRNILNNIIHSHSSLSQLFDSLLEVSRLESGAVKLRIIDLRLKTTIDSIVTEFRPIADSKGLVLSSQCDDYVVKSDPVLLSRILRNLISNALKFTEVGSVNICASQITDFVEIKVIDTGIGIPTSKLKSIFNEYNQLNNPERDRNKGTGLGLAVVRRMTHLLGHSIKVTSAAEQGSCFSVRIPTGELSNIILEPALTLSNEETARQVLVIDDDASVLEAMRAILPDINCTPLLAGSIEQAQELLRQSTVVPDVLISDYRLRENSNGLDAISIIRRQLALPLPAILVTGDTDPTLTQEIRNEGYFLLHKPLKKSHLQTAIRCVIKNHLECSNSLVTID